MMSLTNQRKAVAGLLLAGLVVSLSSCAPAEPKEPLLIIGAAGGMCAGGSCDSRWEINQDGTTSDSEIEASPVEIREAIQASQLRELGEDPEGFCMSYVDGQDLTISVPAWGDEVYTPCRLKNGVADPLSKVAQDLLYHFKREIT